ncbi:O-antigen ligase family protein [Sabulibacter ruber]|uniref:O-antigen ligase family protein n=1 Tax=Sabulibacter ruber TaxID=2811901 RepID=UPI001A96C018|nr:O-antigen ligase family protein [Sabulibacter ruber]
MSVYAFVAISLVYFGERPEQISHFSQIDWVYFSYYLPQNIKFHAPYYSLYIGACLIIHTYFLSRFWEKDLKRPFSFHLLACLFYFVFLALLSSRTSLVATVVVLALVAVYRAFVTRKFLALGIVVLLTVGVGVLVLQKVTYLKMKFSQNAGVAERNMMWISAWEIIKENPVLGVGTGDNRQALLNKYQENDFAEGLKSRFDAHNQFLMHGVSMGFLGGLALILLLLLLLRQAFLRKDYVLFSFVAVFTICCLTESLLQRRDGTLLFSFMVALMVFAEKTSSPALKEKQETDIPQAVTQ